MWEPNTTYFDDANRGTFIVAQIETLEAVENVEAIAAVPGIDCQRVPWGGDFALMNALKRCSEELDGVLAGEAMPPKQPFSR